jgi:hypothetical protein
LFGGNAREFFSALWHGLVEAIQKSAQRRSFRMRRDVMAADDWLNKNLGFTANE